MNQLTKFIDVFAGTGTVAASVGANKSVVTDNDGDMAAINKKYENYMGANQKDYIKICVDDVVDTGTLHIAKLNGRICGAKRSHSVSEQPNCYQSV